MLWPREIVRIMGNQTQDFLQFDKCLSHMGWNSIHAFTKNTTSAFHTRPECLKMRSQSSLS